MRSQCLRVAMALRVVRLLRRRVISGRAMATSVTVVVGLGNGIHIHKFASTAATCMCTDKKDCLRKMPTCQQYARDCCLDCLRKKWGKEQAPCGASAAGPPGASLWRWWRWWRLPEISSSPAVQQQVTAFRASCHVMSLAGMECIVIKVLNSSLIRSLSTFVLD